MLLKSLRTTLSTESAASCDLLNRLQTQIKKMQDLDSDFAAQRCCLKKLSFDGTSISSSVCLESSSSCQVLFYNRFDPKRFLILTSLSIEFASLHPLHWRFSGILHLTFARANFLNYKQHYNLAKIFKSKFRLLTKAVVLELKPERSFRGLLRPRCRFADKTFLPNISKTLVFSWFLLVSIKSLLKQF